MRTEIAPFKSECLWKHGKTNLPAIRQTPREAHHGAQGAHGPYFLCSAPSHPGPIRPQVQLCWSSRHSKELAPCEVTLLWPHVLSRVLIVGAFVMLSEPPYKQEPEHRGHCRKNISNNGSPALFTLDQAERIVPLRENDTHVTRHWPSSLLTIRCFQWFEFPLSYSSIFFLIIS